VKALRVSSLALTAGLAALLGVRDPSDEAARAAAHEAQRDFLDAMAAQEELQKKRDERRRKVYLPADGYAPNPLRAHRNLPCPCGSNRKAKKCHGRYDFLPVADVAQIKAYLRTLSATGFITVRPSEIA
jgi:uncharacterized protein YecA (UPF0149 family)